MKTTLIKIKNLFGISETQLDGSSVEITGKNGVGKSSVLDAIRYALTNASDRDYIIKSGENEGEIIIETDANVRIDRMKRTQKADYKSVKENGREVNGPESFLKTLFTPLQLDPVSFLQMSRRDQNRAILDLIEFDWDLNWINEKFGEIPAGIDYSQNILQVLNDIQAENGEYFQKRQELNREIRLKRGMAAEIAAGIPDGYDADKWESYQLGEKYAELTKAREHNNLIERAKAFYDAYNNKLRGLEAEYELDKSAQRKEIDNERQAISENIARLEAELKAAYEKKQTLDSKLEDRLSLAEARYKEKVAKLDADHQTAAKYSSGEVIDTTELAREVNEAESMKKFLNEYRRMKSMTDEIEELVAESSEFTRKIELARELPAMILSEAKLPLEGLTVENGVPLFNGLPVSNLSEGEKLRLSVDVAAANPSALQIILIDGTEKLSEENRRELYQRCKEKGVQFIATRTTDDNEMAVTAL